MGYIGEEDEQVKRDLSGPMPEEIGEPDIAPEPVAVPAESWLG